MRTRNFDPNEEFAEREKACRRGKMLQAYLPIKRPPYFKRRVTALYAMHKFYPSYVGVNRCFPELGDCIIFLPYKGSLLGKYEQCHPPVVRKYFARLINEKMPKRKELWPKLSEAGDEGR
jgi:hypothetical protein